MADEEELPNKLVIGKHKKKPYWVAMDPNHVMEIIMSDDLESPDVCFSEKHYMVLLKASESMAEHLEELRLAAREIMTGPLLQVVDKKKDNNVSEAFARLQTASENARGWVTAYREVFPKEPKEPDDELKGLFDDDN